MYTTQLLYCILNKCTRNYEIHLPEDNLRQVDSPVKALYMFLNSIRLGELYVIFERQSASMGLIALSTHVGSYQTEAIYKQLVH